MTIDQLITAGGTAGLIATLLFVNYKLGSGAWLAKEAVADRVLEREAAHAREIALLVNERDRAIGTSEILVPAVERLTDALEEANAPKRRVGR